MHQNARITCLFDPLCGWCYGAAPALHRLRDVEGFSVELAPTGLFSGAGARPMDASFAAYAWLGLDATSSGTAPVRGTHAPHRSPSPSTCRRRYRLNRWISLGAQWHMTC